MKRILFVLIVIVLDVVPTAVVFTRRECPKQRLLRGQLRRRR
jgi:hypothetical protein